MSIDLSIPADDGSVTANTSLPLVPQVPNQFPLLDIPSQRIAIIGEAPGEDEVKAARPFVGASGRLLDALLSSANIQRSACFIGNITQIRPTNNEIDRFAWDGPEIQLGLAQLAKDIESFNPHICILLGKTPLRAAMGCVTSISDYRGSLFRSTAVGSPFYGRKCIAAYHPAYALRDYSVMPLLKFDLGRARAQAGSPDLALPSRTYELDLSAEELVARLRSIEPGTLTSVDIEGGTEQRGVRCVGISTHPSTGFIIALEGADGGSRYTLEEETQIMVEFSRLMWDRSIPKVLQNAMYDSFVLAWLWKILIRNIQEDTMLKHWENYCELEKNLGLQTSIYTYEPYYKGDWRAMGHKLWKYCCTDAAVTLEISNTLDRFLTPSDRQHYDFNTALLNPMLYIELKGMKYDAPRAALLKQKYEQEAYEIQDRLNEQAGRQVRFTDQSSAFEYVVGQICFKRSSPTTWNDIPDSTKKEFRDSAHRIAHLGSRIPNLTPSEWGEFSFHLGSNLNVNSTHANGDMQWFLYEKRKYPKQYKKEKGRKTEKLTSDVNACLSLYVSQPEDQTLLDILKLRSRLGFVNVLSTRSDPDGRLRGSYNIVGTETGRTQVSASPTGSGYNLQTTTKKLRCTLTADEGYDMFQCDLAGADGWTVAAWCKALGDSTMWDDYMYGLKPAKIIALVYEFGPEILECSREQLKWASAMVDGDGWVYFACKVIQHGTSYKMGIKTMADNVLKLSYKFTGVPIVVKPAVCETIQGYFHRRYRGIKKWQNHVAETVLKTSKLTSASGHTRKFFGRKRDQGGLNEDTWKQALADEPQNNTTFATNLAMIKLWTDPENRRADGSLIIELLHQVHDALIGQWPKTVRDWARAKVKSYFNNTLKIAGRDVVIPFEGNFGPNWGELNEAM
jgi:uracil-DNA glycosylase family 4